MTLGKMQHELVKAGADSLTCSQCAEAMLLHKHCTANANLTSMQAARMLWLVLICQDTAEVRTESHLLQPGQYMPSHNEETALQFLAAIIRSNAAASEVEAIHVDATARKMTVEILDGESPCSDLRSRTLQRIGSGRHRVSGVVEVLLDGDADFLPCEFHVFVEYATNLLFQRWIVGQRIGLAAGRRDQLRRVGFDSLERYGLWVGCRRLCSLGTRNDRCCVVLGDFEFGFGLENVVDAERRFVVKTEI